MKIINYFLYSVALTILCKVSFSQNFEKSDSSMILRKVIMDGDTFYLYSFNQFILKEFNSKKDRDAYIKLVRNVKKVMPYAKLAAFRLQMMDDNLNQLPSNRSKKKYIKATEDAIKDEFIGQLKKLTISQGKLTLNMTQLRIIRLNIS
jgi:hypothetical protein